MLRAAQKKRRQKRKKTKLGQKQNRTLWQRLKNNSREKQEEIKQKREILTVLEQIRNQPNRDEAGLSTQQPTERTGITKAKAIQRDKAL